MKKYQVKVIVRNKSLTPVPPELRCLVEVDEVAKTVLVTNNPAGLTPGQGVLLKNEGTGKGERRILCHFEGDAENTIILADFSEAE